MTNRGAFKTEAEKWMSKPEVAAMLWGAQQVEDRFPWAFRAFALMYILGLRVGEVRLLRYEHLPAKYIDAAGNPRAIEVPTLKKGKRAKARNGGKPPLYWVPVLAHFDIVRAAFDPRQRDAKIQHKGFLFPSRWEKSKEPVITVRAIIAAWAAARAKAGLPAFYTSHSLRHSASTALGRAGADVGLRARFMRHHIGMWGLNGGATTEIYYHMTLGDWVPWIKNRCLRLPDIGPLSPIAAVRDA